MCAHTPVVNAGEYHSPFSKGEDGFTGRIRTNPGPRSGSKRTTIANAVGAMA